MLRCVIILTLGWTAAM